jgi:RNA polymerase sigma factor (sigma-70 family)
MQDERTDEGLVRLLQTGDDQALVTIMERYTAKLVRYGHRFLESDDDIGDIVQDVFISVYQNARDFDATRRFSPWIYRIAHNAFVDALKRRAKGPVYGLDFDRVVPHPIYVDPIETEKEKEEMRVLLEKHLDELPSEYREIIDLHYYEGFRYQEIADILHIPLGTVGIRLSRAKQRLKKGLTKDRYE